MAQDLRKHSTLRSHLEAKPLGLSLLVAAIDSHSNASKVTDAAAAFAQSVALTARVPAEMMANTTNNDGAQLCRSTSLAVKTDEDDAQQKANVRKR